MIGALIALISLDVCASLIDGGIVYATLAIVGATNTTPIVVTTAAPHKFGNRKVHAVISGVVGNTATNGVWELTPTGTSTFTLGTFNEQGTPVLSVGSGDYVSGGTVRTALPDGRILLGLKYRATNGACPRIVFVPTEAPAFDLQPYGGIIPPQTSKPRTLSQQTPEMHTMRLERQIVTEHHIFDVWTWAAMNPPDPDFGDFDVTQALRNQVIVSLDKLVTGRFQIHGGRWTSQEGDATQSDVRGQAYEMRIEIQQPVTDKPLRFVPNGLSGTITVAPNDAGPDDTITILTPPVEA